ncbi:MAG: THUMP domain-containing protein [Euryarchaeota archaeon]|jgi:tRNA(Ser,Leu) C12 N-acetylase TAN1|uniref:RNA-binding protein n=1 Tax=Methanobacterium sp. MZD130B TaxID=3394378 RepID=UPI001764A134|nr:THUMP domain-containing protein [Euryarchaeota archaeon]HHT18893.1 RNA-binding protein [Methanobacterium sp.]
MVLNKTLENATDNLEIDANSFDLMVTFKEGIGGYYPEIEGMNELELALKNIKSYYIKETEFYDVVTLDMTIEDAYKLIRELNKSPSEFIRKAVLIDAIVPSTMNQIIDTAIEVASIKVSKKETFSVKCELRSKHLESLGELINEIPSGVCKKLNLEYVNKDPDWIILIEELGMKTAIAIQHPDEIFIN